MTSPKKSRKRMVFTGMLVFLFWFGYVRQGALSITPWITWRSGSIPNAVEFLVMRDGQPVSGVAVDTESDSGTSGEQVTDSLGRATISNPSENEVIWIHIDHKRISLRPLPLGETFFAPSSREGLLFVISM